MHDSIEAQKRRYPVSVSGVIFDGADQVAENLEWDLALRDAHMRHETFCLCNEAKPLYMRVNLRWDDTGNHQTVSLATFPKTSPQHAPDCIYFRPGKSVVTGYASRTGRLLPGNIQINVPLRFDLNGNEVSASQYGLSSEERFLDVDMLRALWKKARLDKNDLEKRGWLLCARRMRSAAERFMLATLGLTLHQCLLVGTLSDKDILARRNADNRRRTRLASHQMFVLGRIHAGTEMPDGPHGQMLALREGESLPAIYLPHNVIADFLIRQADVKSAYVDGADIVVLCRIARFRGNNFICTNMAGLAPEQA